MAKYNFDEDSAVKIIYKTACLSSKLEKSYISASLIEIDLKLKDHRKLRKSADFDI